MSLYDLTDKLLKNEDLANKCLLGRVVRLVEDKEIIRTKTCSVLTEQGILFKDVLITHPTDHIESYPHTPEDIDLEGSCVIIAFLNGSINQPFILRYVKSNKFPGAQTSAYVSTLNLLYTSFIDSQDGTTTMHFSKKNHALILSFPGSDSSIRISTPHLVELFSKNLSIDIEQDVEFSANSMTRKIKELNEKVEKLDLQWKELKLDSDKGEFIIDKVKVDNDELKGTIDTLEIESNKKATLKSKNINLSSDSPSDAPVLYNKLYEILNELLIALTTLTVTCTAPGSTSSVPLNVAQFQVISQKLTNLKSKYIKID